MRNIYRIQNSDVQVYSLSGLWQCMIQNRFLKSLLNGATVQTRTKASNYIRSGWWVMQWEEEPTSFWGSLITDASWSSNFFSSTPYLCDLMKSEMLLKEGNCFNAMIWNMNIFSKAQEGHKDKCIHGLYFS